MGFISSMLITVAKGALTSVIGPFIEEAREASVNAAHDSIRSKIVGKMSVDEWADIIIEGVDAVKMKAIEEGGLRYVGGKMKFAVNANDSGKIKASFQLYFLDEAEQWQLAEADTDLPASKFTADALEELYSKKEIVYEVE